MVKQMVIAAFIGLSACHPAVAHDIPDGCEHACNFDGMPEYCKPAKDNMSQWMEIDEKITININGKEFTIGFTKPD